MRVLECDAVEIDAFMIDGTSVKGKGRKGWQIGEEDASVDAQMVLACCNWYVVVEDLRKISLKSLGM